MKSFLQGKKTLAVEPLRPPPSVVAPASRKIESAKHNHAAAPAGGASAAHVEVVKEGDKVVRLVVTCGCGERVEIECLYSAGR